MNEKEIFKGVEYLFASQNRRIVVKCLGEEFKIPSQIAKETGLTTSQVSNSLKFLKEKGLVVCLNEEARKGRLYENTEVGLEVLGLIKKRKL